MGKKWDKFLATVKGAAHSTKKSVVRTVDVAKQKSAIAHKQKALEEMYTEIGRFICTAATTGGIKLSGAGLQGTVECKEKIEEFLILEAEFKDELERMEKMLNWLKTHEVTTKTEAAVEQTPESDEREDEAEDEAEDEESQTPAEPAPEAE